MTISRLLQSTFKEFPPEEAARLAAAAGQVPLLEEIDGRKIILILCNDSSLLLAVGTQDPDDPGIEQWEMGSFADLQTFSSFLHGEFPGASALLQSLPPSLKQYLGPLADKYALANVTEAGHA